MWGLYESSVVLVARRILRLKRSIWERCIINQNLFVSHRDIRFVPVFVRESADDGSIFVDGGSSGWVSFSSVDVTTYYFEHPISVKLCIPNWWSSMFIGVGSLASLLFFLELSPLTILLDFLLRRISSDVELLVVANLECINKFSVKN